MSTIQSERVFSLRNRANIEAIRGNVNTAIQHLRSTEGTPQDVLDLRMELARTNTGDAMRTLTLSKKDTQGEIQKKGHDAVEFAALDYSRHEDVSWWTIDPVIEPSIKPTGETNVREALKALETAEGQLRTFDVETFPTLYEVKDAFFQKPEITQTASMVASARLIQGNLTQAMASMGILLGK